MPTVPPTCRSLSSLEHTGIYIPGVTNQIDVPSCPTPDPDLDDVTLVPVVTGDGMGAITTESSVREDSRNISLSNKPSSHSGVADLTFRSPSSILGTPYNLSPKFEYPFPPNMPDQQPAVPLISPTTLPRQPRDISATYFKLQHRDPPVPPSLSTKGWSTAMNTPGVSRSQVKRSNKTPGTSRSSPHSMIEPVVVDVAYGENAGG